MERPIIEIDEERCNGCGKCILDCAEGALAIVDGKAKLISDIYCDGLGACLNCPQGALRLRTREAPPFDEIAAMQALAARKQSGNNLSPIVPRKVIEQIVNNSEQEKTLSAELKSRLSTWPIQLELMPVRADYLEDAQLLIAAQCAGFALPDIHQNWMQGRVPIIACPKLEDNEKLIERLAHILANNRILNITSIRMSVPCCNLEKIIREALRRSGRDISWHTHVVQR